MFLQCTQKKYLLRIVSIVVILTLFTPVYYVSFADDVDYGKYQNDVDVLTLLGIVPENMELSIDAVLTREQVAKIIANVLGDIQFDKVKVFSDVPTTYPMFNQINKVYNMGLMKGVGNGKFEPNRTITVGEINKILVSLIGYDVEADAKGGYPAGYLVVGSSLGLFDDGLKSEKEITFGEFANALRTALDTDYFKIQKIFENSVHYVAEEGHTYLSEMLKIHKAEGIVKAVGKTALVPKEALEGSLVKIDETVLDADLEMMQDLVGVMAEYYYKENEGFGNDKILVAYPMEYCNDCITIPADNFTDISAFGDNYKLEVETDRTITYKISRYADIIYNNRANPDFDLKTLLNIKNGNVKLIDNDFNGLYDVVIITDYTIMVVDYADPVNCIITTKNNLSQDPAVSAFKVGLPIDKGDAEVVIRDVDGIDLDMQYIKEWYVISALISADKSYYNLIVTNDEVIGVVEEIISGNNKKSEMVISGNTYNFDEEYAINFSNDLLGQSIVAFLDINGNIVGFDKSPLAKTYYGYIVGAIEAEGSKKATIKMFTEKGEFATYHFANNVNVNGALGVKGEDVLEDYSYLMNNQLVCFGLNSKNEVNKIETVTDRTKTDGYVGYDENAFTLDYIGNSDSRYRYESNLLDDRYLLGKKTIIFRVPSEADREDEYRIVKPDDYTNDVSANGWKLYNSDKYKYVDVVLTNSQDAMLNTELFLLNSISRVLDANGNETYLLKGYEGKKVISMTVSQSLVDSASALKPGDMLRISYFDNVINGFSVLGHSSDWSNDQPEKNQDGGTNVNYSFVTARGVINTKGNETLTMNINNTVTPYVYVLNNDTKVYIYSEREKTFTPSTSAILSEGVRVFVHRRYGIIRTIVVYESNN